jgi:hypothetical protein
VLVVLDNFEQVVVPGAPLVSELLEGITRPSPPGHEPCRAPDERRA